MTSNQHRDFRRGLKSGSYSDPPEACNFPSIDAMMVDVLKSSEPPSSLGTIMETDPSVLNHIDMTEMFGFPTQATTPDGSLTPNCTKQEFDILAMKLFYLYSTQQLWDLSGLLEMAAEDVGGPDSFSGYQEHNDFTLAKLDTLKNGSLVTGHFTGFLQDFLDIEEEISLLDLALVFQPALGHRNPCGGHAATTK